ncbi:MAG: TetR/AcrR family transcriptional regulator [Novosphingobium sp.]|nr:TetR/AcrR family transcriptional regulator [Novosphingobium sp.]
MLRKIPRSERKTVILDAVETLILQRSSTEFTMHELASYVGISPTTFYNVFGSKGAVLYALLNRGLDEIINGRTPFVKGDHPAIYAIESMTHAAHIFIKRPNLFRPLYKFQLSERDMADRPTYLNRGFEYWRRSLQGLTIEGYITQDNKGGWLTVDNLALVLQTHSSGVIDLWVQEDLNDQEFIARMTFDAALIVSGVVTGDARAEIAKLIEKIEPCPGRFTFV